MSATKRCVALLVILGGCFNDPGGGGVLDAETTAASSGTSDAGTTTAKSSSSSGDSSESTGSSETTGTVDPACPRSVRILFDEAAKQAGIVDFPLLVRLTPERIDYDATTLDGGDIRFFSADRSEELAYEHDTWHRGGDSFAWVSVPLIDASAEHREIAMCYGGAALPPWESSEVWGDDYLAVWHMSQDVFEAGEALLDSSGNANDGNATGTPSNQFRVPAQAGHGLVFAGNQSAYVGIPTDPSLDLASEVTFEFLYRPSALPVEWLELLERLDAYQITARTQLTDVPRAFVAFAPPFDASLGVAAAIPAELDWTYLTITYSRSDGVLEMCVDAGACNTLVVSDPSDLVGVTSSLQLGQSFMGVIDEVRIASRRRSSAWIQAQNRAHGDALVTFE